MDRINIISLKNVNDVDFGSNRSIVWNMFGKPNDSFKKTSISKTETDDYGNFHVYYDDNYNFEAIEIFKGIDIYYNNYKLSNKYSEVLEYFKSIFNDIEEDEYGFTTKSGSIGVYIENDEDLIDSILFGKENYYD